MTFGEKLAKEHPDCVGPNFCGEYRGCPFEYGYEENNDCPAASEDALGEEKCRQCWEREMPMELPIKGAPAAEKTQAPLRTTR